MRRLTRFAAVLVLAGPAAAQMPPIPLTVRETSGVPRRFETVTTGVPIPREPGVRLAEQLRLVVPGAGEVDAQFRVLSRWNGAPDDESAPIRWVLVDFQVSLSPFGLGRFELRGDGPQGKVAFPLDVTQSPDGVLITTGVGRFHIARDRFNLFDGVELSDLVVGGRGTVIVPPNGRGGIAVRREDGSIYLSADEPEPPTIEIEERGPIRAVVRVSGRLHTQTQNQVYPGQLDYLEYSARYHFRRGSADVRVEFTLRNPDRVKALDYHSGGSEVFPAFDELALRLPVSLESNPDFLTVGDATSQGSIGESERVLLYQDSSGGPNWGPSTDGSPYWSTTFQGYRVVRGDDTSQPPIDEGLRALGVGDLSDRRAGVAVSMRSFWQNFPKGIYLFGDGRIDFQLFPRSWATPHRFRGGLQKTHDLLFQFHAGGAEEADVEAVARAFESPVMALATPELYRDSEALGFFATDDPGLFRTYEEAIRGVLDYHGGRPDTQGNIYREMEDKDEYGWLNWGDHYREGNKNLRYWGNNEFDFSWVMLLGYLRGADHDDRFFQRGEAMARHLIDIDLYHTDRDIFWANRGLKKHDASGVTDHNRDPNLSHFWLDGLVLYYWLTGDEGARDALEEIGQWLLAREEDPIGRPGNLAYCGEVRSKGWVVQALVTLFECLGDRRYFELAQRVIPTEIGAVTSAEGWIANSIGLVDPWMHGYVTEGLGRFVLLARSMNEPTIEARDLMLRILDFQSTWAWSEERGMMAYTWDPDTHEPMSFSSNLSQTAVNGYAYAFLITGGTDFLYWAQRCYESYYRYRGYPYYYSTTLSTPAKNTGFRLRFAQVYMHLRQLLPQNEDGEPPVIRSVRTDRVRYTEARVRFTTNERAEPTVTYWPEGGAHRIESQSTYYREHHVIPLTDLSHGTTYHFVVGAVDLAGNEAAPIVGTFRTWDPDTVPPAISGIEIDVPSPQSVIVRFLTGEAATGSVEYGLTAAYGQLAGESGDPTGDHQIEIPVEPDTVYHFRVVAVDVWGNESVSSDATFQSAAFAMIPATFDAYLVANYGGTRVRTTGPIEVRDNSRLHYDGLLWFDLRSIPQGATVLEATLEITKRSSGTWSPVITVRGVRHTETSDDAGNPLVGFDPDDPCFLYRNRSTAVAWAPGGGSADEAMASVASQFQVFRMENRTYSVPLSSLVQAWLSGVPNEGLFLETHGTGQMAMFDSSESHDPERRPRLHVLYRR